MAYGPCMRPAVGYFISGWGKPEVSTAEMTNSQAQVIRNLPKGTQVGSNKGRHFRGLGAPAFQIINNL